MTGEVAQVVERATQWAAARPDVVGLLLVGSHSRRAARGDSDVDLILLTAEPAAYADHTWARGMGLGRPFRVRSWGAVTERRFVTSSGLEVEINIGSPDWARVDPVDPGTRQVVCDGALVLHDPVGLLAALVDACRRSR